MGGRRFGLAVAALLTLSQGGDLLACGDKFLVASRGTRFHRAGIARRPAAVLVYAPAGTRLGATVDALRLPAALVKVGYAPTVVTSSDALAAALRLRRWDVVLVDLDDSGTVGGPPAPRPPAVVAVAFDAPRDRLQQARRQFAAVVRAPRRADAVVDAIDEALDDRAIRASSQTAN